MAIESLPLHAADLVEMLDAEFPARCIGPSQTPEDAHRYAGKRDLVDFLLRLLADKDEDLRQELAYVPPGKA